MKTQFVLLSTILAYTIGILVGYLVKNNNPLFILLTIPAFIVFLRGAYYEKRWNRIIKDIEDKIK